MDQTRGVGLCVYLSVVCPASAAADTTPKPATLQMRSRVNAGKTVAEGPQGTAAAPAPGTEPSQVPQGSSGEPHPGDPAAGDAAEQAPIAQAASDLSEAEFAKLADQQEEVIIVTGSTIGRKSLTTPAPLTILDRELLNASGQATLGDSIQSDTPSQSNAANAQLNLGGDGTTRINLRGLGISRTLTLINGRRVVPGGWGANTAVDFNSIPLAIVDRVEILKDGASAVYGSDAVGGVVNIITRSDFEGSEAALFASAAQAGDGLAYDASFVTGYNVGSKKANIVFSVGLQNQRPIFAGDRAFSANDMTYDFTNKVPVLGGSTASPDGRINTRAIDLTGDGRPDPVDLCGEQYCTNDGAGGYRPFTTPVDLYNYQPLTYLYTPSSRYHLYSAGSHKLVPEVTMFFEGSYANTKSAQQFAAESFVNTAPISKDSIHNPLGGTVLGYQRRLAEFGPRSNPENLDSFRVVGGFKGKIPADSKLFKNFKWELSYNYGRSDSRVEARGNLIVSRLANAVGPSFVDASGVPTCGTPDKPIAGCVPIDILGPVGSIDPAAADYVTFTGVGKGFNQQQTALAQAQGRLLKLPNNGDLSLAVGGDFRREAGGFTPDPVSAVGDSTGTAIAPTAGSYNVIEGFSELSVVPVSGKRLAEWLEISLAARAFRYNTFGSGVTWKAGTLYRPINGFALRGTFSTAFRAPAISELYQGTTATLLPGSDPCDTRPFGMPVTLDPQVAAECTNQGVPANAAFGSSLTRQQSRSNPSLSAETAKVVTAGIVIEPPQVKGLSLTADYWRVDIDNAIQRLSMSVVFANCYTRHVQSACEQIHRNPFAGYAIDYIDLSMQNIGGTLKSGLDVALAYDHKLGAAGRFREQFESQYLLKADLDNTLQVLHGLNNTDLGATPRVRANLSSLWQHPSGIGAGMTLRYVGAYRECDQNNCNGGAPARGIEQWYKADLFGSYSMKTVAGTTSITVGVNNLLDRAPPPIYGAPLGDYDPTGYDHKGRSFYARLSQSF